MTLVVCMLAVAKLGLFCGKSKFIVRKMKKKVIFYYTKAKKQYLNIKQRVLLCPMVYSHEAMFGFSGLQNNRPGETKTFRCDFAISPLDFWHIIINNVVYRNFFIIFFADFISNSYLCKVKTL